MGEPQLCSTRELFDHKLFKIPFHQRSYAWVQKNLKDLFTDVLNLLPQNPYRDDVIKTRLMGTVRSYDYFFKILNSDHDTRKTK